MPNLVPKKQLSYIPERRECFTSLFAEVKRQFAFCAGMVETRNAFWGELGEQLTVPVCKSAGILLRLLNETEFITGRSLQPSNYSGF